MTVLEKEGNYLRALKQAKKTCCIEEGELKILTPSSVFLYMERLNNKNYNQNEDKTEGSTPGENTWCDRWHPNEYKHFSWLVVGYFYVKNVPISSFVPFWLCRLQRTSNFSPTSSPIRRGLSFSTIYFPSSSNLSRRRKCGPNKKPNCFMS